MRHSKIAVPRPPPHFVERPALRAVLDEECRPAERGRVLLVSAPAGHGKTATLADWTRATPDVPTAWVSLDASDRDEAQWWRTLLAALASCPAAEPGSPLHRLSPSWITARSSEHTDFVAAALNALEDLPTPTRLVLDDVQEIVGHSAFDGLVELLRHPLPMVTVVLSSRFDPPIRVDRLRLDGRLGQLRASALSFTDADAADLFDQEAIDLTEDQVATLVARTEGWIAALRLAALSLHGSDDPAGFVAEFAGDDRSVADYLVGEVLSRLDDADRAVLDGAAVCSPLPVALAAVLSGREDAGEVLDRLEVSTAMVTATDRRREYWRTHELLRSHILSRLRRNRPEHLGELYRRCAAWHDAHGDHVEALRCAAAAGDVETTQVLVRARAIELIGRGDFAVLARSEGLVAGAAADPRVRLVLGLVAVETGDLDRGEALVDSAEDELTGPQSANVLLFRRIVAARVALARGRIDRGVSLADAIHPETADGVPLRALALITRGAGMVTTRPRADPDGLRGGPRAGRGTRLVVPGHAGPDVAGSRPSLGRGPGRDDGTCPRGRRRRHTPRLGEECVGAAGPRRPLLRGPAAR